MNENFRRFYLAILDNSCGSDVSRVCLLMTWSIPQCEECCPTCKTSAFFAQGSENTLPMLRLGDY